MAMKVSEEARQRTDKCPREFACLSSGKNPRCAVRSSVRGVLFVEKTAPYHCPYAMSFGYSYICSCPIRWEIYDRYGI
jgi:hypothetical protein